MRSTAVPVIFAAVLPIALASAGARAGDADFSSVPRVSVQDPSFFRARLEAARASVVRIAMFGDSQETAPWGWGEYYIPHLNARLAEVYGPCGESQLFTNHTAIARPFWLATMQESAEAVPPVLAPDRLPPSLTAHALRAPVSPVGGWARTVLLHDASHCAEAALEGGAWFAAGPYVADVLTASRPGSAGIAWRNAPTDGDVPDATALPVQSGVLSAGSGSKDGGFAWNTTPPLSFAGRRHVQLELAGTSAKSATEVIGVRFRSTGKPHGVVLQSFARGGMRLPDLVAEHGASGAFLRALAPSIAVLHYGANDAGAQPSFAEWKSQLVATIAWMRAELGDPAFPVIIASELRTSTTPEIDAVADRMAVAAHEIALSDARVLALNLRRVVLEEYGWGRSMRYLADTAHFAPYAQVLLAEAFVGELTRALAISDPACVLPNWADCVRTMGASCQQGGCRMEPDFEAIEHGLPWQGAGTDCSDANGDGFSDECPPGGREDFNRDGFIDAADLGILLGSWGTSDPLVDLDNDGAVQASDLAMFLTRWGA